MRTRTLLFVLSLALMGCGTRKASTITSKESLEISRDTSSKVTMVSKEQSLDVEQRIFQQDAEEVTTTNWYNPDGSLAKQSTKVSKKRSTDQSNKQSSKEKGVDSSAVLNGRLRSNFEAADKQRNVESNTTIEKNLGGAWIILAIVTLCIAGYLLRSRIAR